MRHENTETKAPRKQLSTKQKVTSNKKKKRPKNNEQLTKSSKRWTELTNKRFYFVK